MARRQIESLIQLREHYGVTQRELAERMAVGQSAVSKIERRPDPSIEALRAYVAALGGELVVIFRFDERSFEYVGGDSEPPRSR